MILLFPDVETVRLALTGGLVPADITLAPAAVSTDDQGRVYVEPRVAVPRPVAKTLDKLGVKGSKRHGSDPPRDVHSWVEILPLTKAAGPPAVASQTPVLFELERAADLPAVVGEMVRLGNDRQAFRAFAGPNPDADGRVLLRVLGPPYYTLLRAIDPSASGTAGTVRAYLERAPRVWVEVGYEHPLAAQVKVAEGQLALVRPPAEWLFLDDVPFQDVYDLLRFELPAPAADWQPADAPDKLAVPLRLAAGNAADVSEFWVLSGDAVARLDALVRDADDRLVERLTFAVAAGAEGGRTVVLRTRPSKLAPPALPLEDAVGYKPFWKLPNLFVPAGKRLHPTLRRDAVRNLLAPDPDQVVWLDPDGRGGFTPRSLPDAAFRPLDNWVDYVIEAEQAPLAAWVGATTFEFDHFVCKDAAAPKPPAEKPPPGPRERADEPAAKGRPPTKPAAPKPTVPARAVPAGPLPAPESRPPDEWAKRRAVLEDRFLAVDGPLDHPERRALWPELATAYTALKETPDAALSWLNALWSVDPPPSEWLAGWVRAERADRGPPTQAEFDARLRKQGMVDARALVAEFLYLAAQSPPPPWLASRLPAVQAYLDQNIGMLPARAVWLAADRLASLTGSDVLGLARARDRLLLRLLQEGLSPERDLPGFLRYAGARDAGRLRAVRDKCLSLHRAARAWAEPAPANLPYVDLLFAYAFARLGESQPARELVEQARRVLDKPPPATATDPKTWADHKQREAITAVAAAGFLYAGLAARVEQALAGKPAGGPLPADLQARLAALGQQAKVAYPAGGSGNPFQLAEYVVSRFRQDSDILDAEEKREAYAVISASTGDKFSKEVHGLPGIKEPARLAARARQLYRDGFEGHTLPEVRFQVVHAALPLAPRAGEAFALELIDLLPAVLPNPGLPDVRTTTEKQGEVIERALVVAANYGRGEAVQKVVDQLTQLLRAKPEAGRFTLVNVVAGRTLRTLRKLGMRDEIDGLLTRIRTEVLGGDDLPALRRRKPEEWAAALQTLLTLAGGWLAFGLDDRAAPILDAARDDLLGAKRPKLAPKDYTQLARATVAALGQGKADAALPRIAELFARMDPAAVDDKWTGNGVYSKLRMGLVEEVVLALVSDDFALGSTARKWLDDDEYLVRRRVHADMRRHLDRQAH
ncbi:MAG: hypothetical protein K2X82_27315 [Gemmataceae bacterium]|nr:hypothetical protein [Gemmataceae bacterium]